MAKYFIVWNSDKSEGAIFDNETDALSAMDGKHRSSKALPGIPSISTLAERFYETYGEDDEILGEYQEVDL